MASCMIHFLFMVSYWASVPVGRRGFDTRCRTSSHAQNTTPSSWYFMARWTDARLSLNWRNCLYASLAVTRRHKPCSTTTRTADGTDCLRVIVASWPSSECTAGITRLFFVSYGRPSGGTLAHSSLVAWMRGLLYGPWNAAPALMTALSRLSSITSMLASDSKYGDRRRRPFSVAVGHTVMALLPALRAASNSAPSNWSRWLLTYTRRAESRYSTANFCGSSQYRTRVRMESTGREEMTW